MFAPTTNIEYSKPNYFETPQSVEFATATKLPWYYHLERQAGQYALALGFYAMSFSLTDARGKYGYECFLEWARWAWIPIVGLPWLANPAFCLALYSVLRGNLIAARIFARAALGIATIMISPYIYEILAVLCGSISNVHLWSEHALMSWFTAMIFLYRSTHWQPCQEQNVSADYQIEQLLNLHAVMVQGEQQANQAN
jgi:hypothetical protein